MIHSNAQVSQNLVQNLQDIASWDRYTHLWTRKILFFNQPPPPIFQKGSGAECLALSVYVIYGKPLEGHMIHMVSQSHFGFSSSSPHGSKDPRLFPFSKNWNNSACCAFPEHTYGAFTSGRTPMATHSNAHAWPGHIASTLCRPCALSGMAVYITIFVLINL